MSNLTWGSYRELSDVVNLMHETSSKIYESRKQDLDNGTSVGGSGKDILTSLSECPNLCVRAY
jgi:hypothetical protein